jgi:hypothetical protein
MPNDFSTIDLGTINVAHDVIVSAIRHKVCEWEQKSSDLATDGNLTNAVMVKHWAFCADILATTVSTEFTNLFSKALNARFGDLTATHIDPHPIRCLMRLPWRWSQRRRNLN